MVKSINLKIMCKVDPKIDLVFKKLFGVDQNKDLLLSLVNSMLTEDDKMKEVTIKNPYNVPDYLSGKLSVLDIKAEDEKGKRYNIEMQIVGHDDYGRRTLFYWAKAFTEQIGTGGKYSDLNKTIVINIVDFEFFKEREETPDIEKRYHRETILMDRVTNEKYEQLDYISVHFVELSKYKDDIHGIKNTLDRWITFLNRAGELTIDNLPEELATEEIKKAVSQLNHMHLEKKEQEHYDRQQLLLMDEKARIETALRRGKMEGKIEGKIEVAKELKVSGVQYDIIAKSTGLNIKEIEKL